jgi:hypothetical protein
MLKKSKRGQNLSEYAMVLAVAGAIFAGMQYYLQRSLQMGIKLVCDQFGRQEDMVALDPGDASFEYSWINESTRSQTMLKTDTTKSEEIRAKDDYRKINPGSVSFSAGGWEEATYGDLF